MALSHVIESKTEQAYRRGDLFDKRRRMMADWAKFLGERRTLGGEMGRLEQHHSA